MNNILDYTLAEILEITLIPEKDIDPMIYNVCDYAGLICPLSNELCDEQCRKHFESRVQSLTQVLSDDKKTKNI